MSDVGSLTDIAEREFVLILIGLYRDHPELWKVKSNDYLNKNKRCLALGEIVRALNKYKPNFSEDCLKKKINILRTNFNKEYQRIEQKKQSCTSDDVPEPTLWYYNDLLFIKDQEDAIETASVEKSFPVERHVPPPVQAVSPPPKRKKLTPNNTTEDLLSLASAYFKRPETEAEILAKGWAMKLSRLASDQRCYAEKIINDTLFEAELGTLTRHGACFLTASESPSPARTNASPAPCSTPAQSS